MICRISQLGGRYEKTHAVHNDLAVPIRRIPTPKIKAQVLITLLAPNRSVRMPVSGVRIM